MLSPVSCLLGITLAYNGVDGGMPVLVIMYISQCISTTWQCVCMYFQLLPYFHFSLMFNLFYLCREKPQGEATGRI